MKKFVFRMVGLVLVLVLFASMFSACGSSKNTADGSSATESKKTEGTESKSVEKLELNYAGYTSGGAYVKEDEYLKTMEDRFNVKINRIDFSTADVDKRNLFWASGGTADVYIMRADYRKLADDGIIRPISEELLYKIMPQWMNVVAQIVGNPENVKEQLYYKDKVWGVPWSHYAYALPFATAVRSDWMENVGIKTMPATLDELYELLNKFTYNDPDKNGKNDTYGICPNMSAYSWGPIFGAFGLQPKSYYKINGKVEYTSATSDYKDALKLLASWYKKGLIDPDFVTDPGWDDYHGKFINGKVGLFGNRTSSLDPYNGTQKTFLTEINPDAKMDVLYTVKGPSGKEGLYCDYISIYSNFSAYFGKDTSDEKVEKIMEIMETVLTDNELMTYFNYGVKDKDYTVNENGTIARSQSLTDQRYDDWGYCYYAMPPLSVETDVFQLDKNSRDYLSGVNKNYTKAYGKFNFFSSAVNESYNTLKADIEKVADMFFMDAVTGSVDIDKDWDGYISKLNAAGLQKVIDEYNNAIK